MSAIRQFLVSTLIFAAVPPAVLSAANAPAEYVGGTVKSIPVNSTGALSFDDAKEVRFNYSGSMYNLPYDQITSTEIGRAEGRRILGRIPVPSLVPSRRKQTLIINYKDAAGATGAVNFEMTAREAATAQDTIQAKQSPQQHRQEVVSVQEDPSDHFTDTYWKTLRNQSQWEAKSASNSPNGQAAPGTK